MSDEILNKGSKGKVIMKIIIGLVLFIALVSYVMSSNMNGVPLG